MKARSTLLKQLTVFFKRKSTTKSNLVNNGLEEHGDEDEIQKTAATIEEETGISQNTVIKSLDKTHVIGQVDDASKQKIIVKFTTDSFRETV